MIINAEMAFKADGSAYLSNGGVFNATITKAKVYSVESGVKGIEFAFDTTGGKCDFVKVMTKNRDGSENFNIAHIHALGVILGINELVVKDSQISNFLDKQVGVALQREDYQKNDGSLGYKFNLLHFFDATTMQTAREKHENKAPSTSQREVKDKRILKENLPQNQNQGYSPEPDSDLPF